MEKVKSEEVQKRFEGKKYVTRDDLKAYFQVMEPDISENSVRWHIHQLKESQSLVPVRRGVYSFNQKPLFEPIMGRKLSKLYNHVSATFSPGLKRVVWSTDWLSQFMVLQPTHSMIILEIEKEYMRTIFDALKNDGRNAFLNPSKDVVLEYVLRETEPIVILPYVSRSPLIQVKEGIETVSLEKMLVDIFCDKDLFVAYQGEELATIFNRAWKHYSLNLSALINYAKRRKRYEALVEFLASTVNQELYSLVK